MKRELRVGVAMRRPADAGDPRRAGEPARLDGQAAGVTGGDREAGARDGVRGTGGHAGRVAPGAAIADRGPRRQLEIDDDQRAIRPPRSEHGVNLQTERPRPTEPRRLSQALERDQRLGAVERIVDRVRCCERRQRVGHGTGGHPPRVAVERVRRAVGRLRALGGEPIEERRAARTDDDRGPPARQQPTERQRRNRRAGGVERGRRDRYDDVEPPPFERTLERGEGRCVAVRRRAALPRYLSWNGYGVENPSDGGKLAVFTAASTHVPVGVPANFPVTVAVVTLPLLPITMLTIAVPGTLNWL